MKLETKYCGRATHHLVVLLENDGVGVGAAMPKLLSRERHQHRPIFELGIGRVDSIEQPKVAVDVPHPKYYVAFSTLFAGVDLVTTAPFENELVVSTRWHRLLPIIAFPNHESLPDRRTRSAMHWDHPGYRPCSFLIDSLGPIWQKLEHMKPHRYLRSLEI